MGLALLANLAAYDFGYISAGQLIERTANAFHTMQALERYRGHFYNWYDTQTLKPLLPYLHFDGGQREPRGPPADVAPGAAGASRSEDPGARLFDGLEDTLVILVDAAGDAAQAELARLQKDLESACRSPPTTLAAARQRLDRLAAIRRGLSPAASTDDR